MYLFTLTFEHLLYAGHHPRLLGVSGKQDREDPGSHRAYLPSGNRQKQTNKCTMKAAELNYFRSLSFAPMESSKKEETCKHIYDQALSPVFAGWFPKNFPPPWTHTHIYKYTHAHRHTPSSWTCNAPEIYIMFSCKICKRQIHVILLRI